MPSADATKKENGERGMESERERESVSLHPTLLFPSNTLDCADDIARPRAPPRKMI